MLKGKIRGDRSSIEPAQFHLSASSTVQPVSPIRHASNRGGFVFNSTIATRLQHVVQNLHRFCTVLDDLGCGLSRTSPHRPSECGDVLDVWLLVVEGVRCTPTTTNNHTFETRPGMPIPSQTSPYTLHAI
ncbi:hypothetical protein ACQ4M4_05300 [Leptolyngbya sp. AN02str]|uniref:hypothetical protein n=1 Tax=Leptolyngbya sp. AN02str TaxID=3423363 RepID=UPI003D322954